jgi:5-methylcytosine-specific restriction endonuclease McrA
MYEMKEQLYAKYGQRCEVCNRYFKKSELTGHHIVERSKGGKISETNILIACKKCHFQRINKMQYNSPEYLELMAHALSHRKLIVGS